MLMIVGARNRRKATVKIRRNPQLRFLSMIRISTFHIFSRFFLFEQNWVQKIVFGHASQKFVNKKPRREFSITLQWYISFAPPEVCIQGFHLNPGREGTLDCWLHNFGDFYWILIGWSIKLNVQTFQPLIVIYRRGYFV